MLDIILDLYMNYVDNTASLAKNGGKNCLD